MLGKLVTQFQRKLTLSDVTRRRVEDEYRMGKLVRRDVEIVYEGLFLRAVVGFEDLLESIFFAVLEGRSGNASWYPRLTGRRSDLKKCVFGEKRYLDWLPYAVSLKRAQLYLRDGLPFSLLDDGDKLKLSQIVTIRHAIAHSSKSASQKFTETVIDTLALPASEKKPAGFLRGITAHSLTRYEVYVQSLGGIANTLR